MLLTSATVGPFKSINQPQTVKVDPAVTVLVGMNEAGKTVFLQALEKCGDVLGAAKFEPVEDYPRKELSGYLKRHKEKPETAAVLEYQLTAEEIAELNKEFDTNLPAGFTWTERHRYDNTSSIGLKVDERPTLAAMLSAAGLSTDASAAMANVVNRPGFPGGSDA